MHADLDRATESISNGDTVLLGPGTHELGGLYSNKQTFTLIGWGGREAVVLQNDPSDDFCVDSTGDRLEIRGCTIRNRGAFEGAVHARAGAVVLRDCVVDCGGYSGCKVAEGAAAKARDLAHPKGQLNKTLTTLTEGQAELKAGLDAEAALRRAEYKRKAYDAL